MILAESSIWIHFLSHLSVAVEVPSLTKWYRQITEFELLVGYTIKELNCSDTEFFLLIFWQGRRRQKEFRKRVCRPIVKIDEFCCKTHQMTFV